MDYYTKKILPNYIIIMGNFGLIKTDYNLIGQLVIKHQQLNLKNKDANFKSDGNWFSSVHFP